MEDADLKSSRGSLREPNSDLENDPLPSLDQIQAQFVQGCIENDLDAIEQLASQRTSWEICHFNRALAYAIEHDQVEIARVLVAELDRTRARLTVPSDSSIDIYIDYYQHIETLVLASSNPEYWEMLLPYLGGRFNNTRTEFDYSLELLRHLHQQGKLTDQFWIIVFQSAPFHADLDARIDACWQILLSPSGIPTDDDYDLISKAIMEFPTSIAIPATTQIAVFQSLIRICPSFLEEGLSELIRLLLVCNYAEFASAEKKVKLLEWAFHVAGNRIESILFPILPDFSRGSKQLLINQLVMRKTASHCLQFYVDSYSWTGMLVTRTPLERKVRGWTSFYAYGRYFYSTDLYLDVANKALVSGETDLAVFPAIQTTIYHPPPLRMPVEEERVELAYGPEYQEMIEVAVPSILLDWSHHNTNAAKSARSAMTE